MEKKLFDKLIRSTRLAVSHSRGNHIDGVTEYRVFAPKIMNVKTIRKKIGMTQQKFSETFGFDKNSVASWESGRRNPDKSARILLKMIDKNPKMVLELAAT